MWLLVGLGNPGTQYENNRHNVGFMMIDAIAGAQSVPGGCTFRAKFHGQIAETAIAGEKVLLLKPQTYMNNSGQSVQAAAKFYKIPPEKVIVFHDELDLAPGKIKVRLGGGNAGHNGLRSIQAHLGTPDFQRVRIGIGHPGDKDKVTAYVLGDFSKADREWLTLIQDSVVHNLSCLLTGFPDKFMTRIHAQIHT